MFLFCYTMRLQIDLSAVDRRIVDATRTQKRRHRQWSHVSDKISHAWETNGRVTLTLDEWQDLIDAIAAYDSEHFESLSPVWRDLQQQVRDVPEYHEYLEQKWVETLD